VQLATAVRRATAADAPALAELVNRAYAVEAFFVDGMRTSAAEVAQLIARGTFVVLESEGGLVAAIHIEPRGTFGMLAVAPEAQGHGLGTRLVRIAEAVCEAMGCEAVALRIVNVREELGRWYRSLGYRETGTAPFDGPSKVPCHFVEMRKSLAVTAAAA
jgi:N-acetylglutamate synthase-like GNAT family acetyltransferase